MLLSTAYFPPIEYFALLARYSSVNLEACEHYQKQSWRNRCRILTANGTMDLRVPVVHGPDLFHTPVSEVLVDYSTSWVAQTEYAIESAYYSSPFFVYYKDALFAILDSHPGRLWDLNLEVINFFCRKIGLAPAIVPTTIYVQSFADSCPFPAEDSLGATLALTNRSDEAVSGGEGEDFRDAIHPKRENTIMKNLGLEREYWQVFRERFGFVPGLSIMDLLFNEGPESICYLK